MIKGIESLSSVLSDMKMKKHRQDGTQKGVARINSLNVIVQPQ